MLEGDIKRIASSIVFILITIMISYVFFYCLKNILGG